MIRKRKPSLVVVLGSYPDTGKGILVSACGYLLKQVGLDITILKFDGYLNLNSGTMNPYHQPMAVRYAHEEVYMLRDGFEADADSGYYERFLGQELIGAHNMTGGKAFQHLREAEAEGRFPAGEILKLAHVRDIYKNWIFTELAQVDVAVLEIGGTVGDSESSLLYDAIDSLHKQRKIELLVILLSPYFASHNAEFLAQSNRTKLARQAFERAWHGGLHPDMLVMRCEPSQSLSELDRDFLAQDCSISPSDVFVSPHCNCLYELPKRLVDQGFSHRLLLHLELASDVPYQRGRLEEYIQTRDALSPKPVLQIAIFGKAESCDSFVSLGEAVDHAATALGVSIKINWVEDAVNRGENWKDVLLNSSCLIVGEDLEFAEEKLHTLTYARIHGIPTLALSFGADLAILEFAQNVCGASDAFIEEIGEGIGDVKIYKGINVRGSRVAELKNNSILESLYPSNQIEERHRHCSWPTDKLVALVSAAGLQCNAVGEDGKPEAFELVEHPFYVAMKAHVEYKSWPGKPSPPFVGLIQAAKQYTKPGN